METRWVCPTTGPPAIAGTVTLTEGGVHTVAPTQPQGSSGCRGDGLGHAHGSLLGREVRDEGGKELHAHIPSILLQCLHPQHQQLHTVLSQLSKGEGQGRGKRREGRRWVTLTLTWLSG